MIGRAIRILLISDTHGDLSIINELAERRDVEAVIHAGDFGFYDQDSVDRISSRELRLRIRHSHLSPEERVRGQELDFDGLRAFVRKSLPMSDLPDYLDGTMRFRVPVYAVWGNHEDRAVVARFRKGEYQVENLFTLDESRSHRIGRIHLFGLGGNIVPGSKLFDSPIAGGGGKVWSTLSQMELLRQTVKSCSEPGDIRVLITHVSPGKEPLVWRLAAHTRSDFAISGHMAPSYCTVWNEFAIREAQEAQRMIESRREAVESAWNARSSAIKTARERELAERGMQMIRELPLDQAHSGRRGSGPRWTRSPICINLPDASSGHAVIIVDDEKVSLETYSEGQSFAGLRASSEGPGSKRN